MKILIVVDMQNDFIDGVLGNNETKAVVPAVVKKIEEYAAMQERGESAFVYFTMDTHGDDYLQTQEGRKLPVPHCIKGTYGWQLNEKISEVRKKLVGHEAVTKCTFGSMKLIESLYDTEACGADTAELVGVCTDICVISNAMLVKAAFPEAEVIVDGRCCAGVTPESHERALKAMEACQITVLR